jgi:O-antigen/teichoic acid export membrane protein
MNKEELQGRSKSQMKRLFGSILRLGTGEAVSRLASFGLYAYVSRVFGVELLGIVALSQTIASYVTLGTDQGLRMIGARLVARDASAAPSIIGHILKKRLISCAVCVSLACVYALWGPVPANARLYVLGFALAVIPYAFSLDWLAWGLDHFGWLGAWRAGVGVLFVAGAIAAIRISGTTLLPITIANGASAVLGAVMLWSLWHFRWQSAPSESQEQNNEIANQLRWAAVLPLGVSTMLNLMFNNFDTVMLGAMTSAKEVGRYSAAYKILFVIFGTYYLVTQSLYPKLSRMKGGREARRLLAQVLLGLGVLGGCLALVIGIWAGPILRILYGADLSAVHLLRLLSFAIPMDFCAAMMGTVLVSRGFDKPVLWGAAAAALSNVLMNLWLIPQLSATGAAWATVISYLVLLVVLGSSCLMQPLFLEAKSAPDAVGAMGSPA